MCRSAGEGDVAAVQACLAAGADPDALVEHASGGQAALHTATDGKHLACIETLLAAGAYADIRDAAGRTPLQLAAHGCCPACVAVLLAAGANPRAADSLGATALHAAAQHVMSRYCFSSNLRVVRQLLAADASAALLRDGLGRTPFEVAVLRQAASMARVLLVEAPQQPATSC